MKHLLLALTVAFMACNQKPDTKVKITAIDTVKSVSWHHLAYLSKDSVSHITVTPDNLKGHIKAGNVTVRRK